MAQPQRLSGEWSSGGRPGPRQCGRTHGMAGHYPDHAPAGYPPRMRPLCLALVIALGCSPATSTPADDAGADCGAPPDGFFYAGPSCNPRCFQPDGAFVYTTCGIDAGAPYCANPSTDPLNCGECANRCRCTTGFPQCRLGLCRCSLTP